MATDAGVGDVEFPRLTVQPYDTDTQLSLTITAPDGTQTTPGTVVESTDTVAGSRTWRADPVTYTQPGRWVELWTVTGTGAGTEPLEVYVVPVPTAGGPTWTPGRTRVATYVPGRTLVPSEAGANVAQQTFDSSTRPTGVQVDRLIADAVAWVLTLTGEIHASLFEMAAATAAVWSAAMVEQGYPDREAAVKQTSVDIASDLLKQAVSMREDLARANAAANGSNPTNPNSALLPLWSFPRPVAWGDDFL